MTKLNQLIREVEKKWFEELFQTCAHLMNNQNLPSHDHWHHLRVWQFIKELLFVMDSKKKNQFDSSFIEALIIAAFFHDTGMKDNRGKKHGKISREVCEDYFSQPDKKTPENFSQTLYAIENHDNKDYANNTRVSHKNLSILTALNIADDLDAFGFIGIIRYAEIYMLRGDSIQKLRINVLKNAGKRFNHFKATFFPFSEYINKHKYRFDNLIQFYRTLNQNKLNYTVIKNIQFNIGEGKYKTMEDLIKPVSKETQKFVINLKKELSDHNLH